MPLQYQLLEILVNPTVSYLLILLGLVGIGDRAVQPRADRARDDRRDLAPARPLRDGAASGDGRGGAAARLRRGDDHRRGAPAHPRHPRGLRGGGADRLRACSSTTPTRARSRSRPPVVIVVGLDARGPPRLRGRSGRSRRAACRSARAGRRWSGAVGEVRQPLDPIGQIFVEGALWRARRPRRRAERRGTATRLERGSRVRVESVEGLTLHVRPLEGEPDAAEDAEPRRREQTKELQWVWSSRSSSSF